MKSEPKPKKGARCAVDGRPLPKAARREGDPFCSTTCCKTFHGIVFLSDKG